MGQANIQLYSSNGILSSTKIGVPSSTKIGVPAVKLYFKTGTWYSSYCGVYVITKLLRIISKNGSAQFVLSKAKKSLTNGSLMVRTDHQLMSQMNFFYLLI